MRGRLFYSLLCIILVTQWSDISGQEISGKKILRILTYNIHHANPPSRPDVIDMPAIAAVIKRSGADIVALQELDINNERSGISLDQATELGRLTGMYHFFAKGIDYRKGEYGVGILSRFPIKNAMRYALPMKVDSGGEPRALAVITVEPFKGEELIFASTHMDLIPENRELQAAFIVETLGKMDLPVIFCGDLNAEPGSSIIRSFETVFRRSVPNGLTYPHTDPKQRLDYIMYRPSQKFKVVKGKIIDEIYASDHLPVYAELKWKQ